MLHYIKYMCVICYYLTTYYRMVHFSYTSEYWVSFLPFLSGFNWVRILKHWDNEYGEFPKPLENLSSPLKWPMTKERINKRKFKKWFRDKESWAGVFSPWKHTNDRNFQTKLQKQVLLHVFPFVIILYLTWYMETLCDPRSPPSL